MLNRTILFTAPVAIHGICNEPPVAAVAAKAPSWPRVVRIFGLGSDIGGSLRVPAHFSGISSLKPTSPRLTGLDNPAYFDSGQEAIIAQSGPMARTVADLDLGMRILAAPGQETFDSLVPPVPLGESASVTHCGVAGRDV